MTAQKKILDLTGSQYLVQKVKSAISDVDSSLSTHIADTDIHVTTADKATWNTVTSKANDSDVVHKSGNETISGVKTFTDSMQFKSNVAEYGVTSGSIKFNLMDKNGVQLSKIDQGVFNNGISYITLQLYGKDSNNQTVTNLIKYQYASTFDYSYLLPTDNSVWLGSTGNRFGRIYGIQYYYGSNNVEFSTKFVTTDTNQTISGAKTFSSDITLQGTTTPVIKTISNIIQDSTGGNESISWVIRDKTDSNTVFSQSVNKFSGQTVDYRLDVTSILNGTSTTRGIRLVVDPVNASYRFTSSGNNTLDLGSSTNNWRSVYAMNYYYGSNNVEFSTKFVTTDTAQTISGNKTFSSNVNVYNSDNSTDTANIVLKNSKVERGSTTNIGEQTIFFLDKDDAQIGNIKCEVDSYGVSTLNIQCTNPSNSSSGIRLRRTSVGTFLQPTFNNGCNLGTPGYRWYDVQTRAVNSLEPSSLSLPSGNLNDIIDISSYLTYLDGSSANTYIAPANGWISITMGNSSGIQAYITGLWGHQVVRPTAGGVRFLMPILKDKTANILIFGGTIDNARFIPCQGNV